MVIWVKIFKTEKALEIQQARQVRHVVKFKVKRMAKSLLKLLCYCQMFLMRTTKTAVCLQTNHLYGF